MWNWALCVFPWRLKLNVTRIIQPSTITTLIPIWAMTMTKFGYCQLEVKVNRTQMTQLLQVLTFLPN
jgi:hypothetical protein